MNAKLSPIVSEFETEEAAASYDSWFRAKVAHSLANPGQPTPHDAFMAELDAIIDAADSQRARA
jgi:hypothetical protein